jgi:N-acetylglucosamine-6-sulfatase
LNAVDQSINALLDSLDSQGQLDNTVILFLSDNGLLFGEHRLINKNWPYEESVRVPFAMRYPPVIAAGRSDGHVVANIDIAPTIYDLVGIPAPEGLDGRSLLTLLNDQSSWREGLLLEGWNNLAFSAVVTEDWSYIETVGDVPELYNLAADPFEIQNQARNPAFAPQLEDLRLQLRALTAH